MLPLLAWAGVGLFAVALTQLPASFSSWHVLGTVGMVLLVAAAARARPAEGSIGLAPALSEGIDRRVEDLKDIDWQLRESEARYRDLLDTQSNVIARRDGEGRLTFVNQAFCRMFGVESEAVLGQAWWPKVLAEERTAATPIATAVRYLQLVETAQGPRWLELDEQRVPGGRSREGAELPAERFEIQVVGSDITQARASRIELAAARDEAQAADRAKSRFLAAMSHEIRTPMNGIMGMASLLDETRLSPEQQSYLGAIDQSARTLLLLIDEILDFSKIEAGKLELKSEPFALADCVQGAVELLAPQAYQKGLEIAWTCDATLPFLVNGDVVRVRQIVLNLIGNAVKYTDRGGVAVNITCEGRQDGSALLAVRVKDTGIGLSRDALGQIFGEFNQGDSDVAQRRGGTGLGLAISRRLARAMGGDVTVESELGRGALFTARMSLPIAIDRPENSSRRLPTGAGTVMLAFDRIIERRALAANLTAIGFEVVQSDDPLTGEEFEAAAAAGKPVCFVVCDGQAPPSEAGEILSLARRWSGGRDVRGVLLIDPETRPGLAQFKEAGFTSYLVRPVRPSSLRARFDPSAMQDGLDERIMQSDGAQKRRLPNVVDKYVLLAEDNAVNALLATKMLEKSGCTVVHVGDGEQAVAAVARSLEPGQRRFDLVLMDIHMPRLDGLEAATRIKALGEETDLPLPPMVALTANAFSEDRDRCLAAGLDDYLAKPFQKADLLNLIERWNDRAGTHPAEGKAA